MKKIYFVRHGESEGNVGPIRQTAVTPLTEKGRSQAAFVADRCVRLPIEIVVCSNMVRARQTAQIIVEKIAKPIEYSDLFLERRRAKEVLGKPKDDPAAEAAEQAIHDSFHLPAFRYSDEENFEDLKNRASAALKFLADRPEENILVITHGFFMKIMLAYAIFGEQLTGEECVRFIRTFHMDNTGITVLGYGYDGKIGKMPWWVSEWNDHAHLG